MALTADLGGFLWLHRCGVLDALIRHVFTKVLFIAQDWIPVDLYMLTGWSMAGLAGDPELRHPGVDGLHDKGPCSLRPLALEADPGNRLEKVRLSPGADGPVSGRFNLQVVCSGLLLFRGALASLLLVSEDLRKGSFTGLISFEEG